MAHDSVQDQLVDCQRRYREIAAQIAEIGFVASGSIAARYNRCGTPGCRCHADPPQPHGPYWHWTAKVNGKTVNRRLNAREAELYKEWISNDRRLRSLVTELHETASTATQLILEEVRRQASDSNRV
jgi:hypothetical protein